VQWWWWWWWDRDEPYCGGVGWCGVDFLGATALIAEPLIAAATNSQHTLVTDLAT